LKRCGRLPRAAWGSRPCCFERFFAGRRTVNRLSKEFSMRWLLRLSLLICTLDVSKAEVSSLVLTFTRDQQGDYLATVHNGSAVPATAYVILRSHVSLKSGQPQPGFLAVDSVLDPPGRGNVGPLQPGDSRTADVGRPQFDETMSLAIGAVVFADGRTEGDHVWIDRLVGRRQRMLDDIQPAVAILNQALTDRSAATSIVRNFKVIISENSASSHHVFDTISANAIPHMVISALENAHTPDEARPASADMPIKTVLERLATVYSQLAATYQNSRSRGNKGSGGQFKEVDLQSRRTFLHVAAALPNIFGSFPAVRFMKRGADRGSRHASKLTPNPAPTHIRRAHLYRLAFRIKIEQNKIGALACR
jgi:hypothetical protein